LWCEEVEDEFVATKRDALKHLFFSVFIQSAYPMQAKGNSTVYL